MAGSEKKLQELLSQAIEVARKVNSESEEERSDTGCKKELERLFPNIYQKKPNAVSMPRGYQSKKKRRTSTATWVSNNKKRQFPNGSEKQTSEKTVKRTFVCLADKDRTEIPTAKEKRNLIQCGLGEKQLRLPTNGGFAEMHAVIMESFPSLSSAGGIELMYSEQGDKSLQVIPSGPDGLTVDYVTRFVGQGRVYIRPIQCSLVLNSDAKSTSKETSVLDEMCYFCLEFVPMDKLREHMKRNRVESFKPRSSPDPKATVFCCFHLEENEDLICQEGCPNKKTACLICLGQVEEDDSAHPSCCNAVFHEECLKEWHMVSHGDGSQCPACNQLFFYVNKMLILCDEIAKIHASG